MSAILSSSHPQDDFMRLSSLSEEDQKKYINQKTSTDELVNLFKLYSNDEKVQILLCKKIQNLISKKKSFNTDQIEQIVSICKQSLPSADMAKSSLIKIIKGTIDSTNYLDRIEFALENEDRDLLYNFFRSMNNTMHVTVLWISPNHLLIKNFKVHEIGLFLDLLMKNIPLEKIQIVIDTERRSVNETHLLAFVSQYGEHLDTLNLSEKMLVKDSGLTTDEVLEKIITNCPNLRQLKLSYLSISGAGLKNLHLCKELQCLTFTSCPSLQVIPELNISLNVKISFCAHMTEQVRVSTFLTFFESNPTLALNLLKSFEFQNNTIVGDIVKQKDFKLYLQFFNEIYHPNAPEGIPLLNVLVENDPQKAIQYVYTLSNEGRLLIGDKQTFALAVENYCLPHDPNKALRLAIDCDDCELARKAIATGADVNFRDHTTTPLLRACKFAGSELVELLLANNADVKCIGGSHDHETPLSEARFRGHLSVACLALLTEKDGGFTDEVLTLKLLAHKFSNIGLKQLKVTVDGKEFYLEGFRPRVVVHDYVNKSKSVYEALKREFVQGRIPVSFSVESQKLLRPILQDSERCEKLLEAIDTTLSSIAYCMDYSGIDLQLFKEALLMDLRNGKPIACFGVTNLGGTWHTGGANLHAWGLVIIKDPHSEMYRIHRCDRSGGSVDLGIEESLFTEEQTLEMMETYQKLTNWKKGPRSDQTLRSQFLNPHRVYQKTQKSGVCCYYSLQSIELALLISLFRPIFGENGVEKLAKEVKSYRTSLTRFDDLKNYLDSHFPDKVNWTLVNTIFDKVNTDSLIRYKRLIVDFALRVSNLQSDIPKSIKDFIASYEMSAIESYRKMRAASSEEDQASAISELSTGKTDLILDMIDFVPMERGDLLSWILKEYPQMIVRCLKNLGYTIMEAFTFCMNRQMNPIILEEYGDYVNHISFGWMLINEVEGIENVSVNFGTRGPALSNNIVNALAKGLRNTTTLKLSKVPIDVRAIQKLAKCCPQLNTLSFSSSNHIDFNEVPPAVSFPHLTHLEIKRSYNNYRIDAEVIRVFGTCFPNLTSLRLINFNKIDADVIKALAIACPKLISLDLPSCENVQFIAGRSFVGGFPDLTSLNIAYSQKIDIPSIRAFATYCPNLTSLKLSDKNLRSWAFEELAKACPHLQSLEIHGSVAKKTILITVSTRFSHLKTLSFVGTSFKTQIIRGLKRNYTIQELGLERCQKIEKAAVLNGLARAYPNLRKLNLHKFNYEKRVNLNTLTKGFLHLHTLDFSGYRKITPETFLAFNTLCPNLITLKLQSCRLDAYCLSALASACPKLCSLDLSSCIYEKKTLPENLSICFPNVDELDLSDISDREVLSQLISYCPNLVNLTLRSLLTTYAFVETLAKACPKLTKLSLNACGSIGTVTLKKIANFFPEMTHLSLSESIIRQGGIQVLVQEFQNLVWLNLSKCKQIDAKDLQEIGMGLPKLREFFC